MKTKLRIIALTAVATLAISASAQSTSKPSGNITTPTYSSSKAKRTTTAPVAKPTVAEPLATDSEEPAQDTTSEPTPIPETDSTPAPAPAPIETPILAKRPADSKILLPIGTALWMKLDSAISTQYSRPGQEFTGKITYDVVIDGKTVIPVGSKLTGRITRLSEPRRIAGRPGIMLVPTSVTLANGRMLPISAVVVDTGDPNAFSVSEEGRIKGPNFSKSDKIKFAAGTAAGTTIGTIVEPGMGTLVGAGVGATAATTEWLIRRRSLELPAGTLLVMEISNPVETQTTAVPATANGGN